MTYRESLHIPRANDIGDPTALGKETESEATSARYWEDQSKKARAKREFESEERQARIARTNESSPPEAPFTIKGSVNLGDIDFQKNQEELRATIERIQTESKTRMEKLESSNADYRDKVAEIRGQMIENTLKAQIDNLQRSIAANNIPGGNASIIDRFNEITQIAGMLGFVKPDPAAAQEAVPATLQLQMLKMEMEEKCKIRQFEWDKIESERNWTIQIKKLELEAQGRKDELSNERDKRGSWISPFESIGAALARGFSDMGTETEARPPKVPKAPKAPKTAGPTQQPKTFTMEAGESDSGTVSCPECQEPIAIAPRAIEAFCPSCESTIQIQRVADGIPQTVRNAGLV